MLPSTSTTEKILDKIDPRTITSAGGVLIALFMSYLLYTTIGNNLNQYAKNQEQTNQALRDLVRAVDGNTQVIQLLLKAPR